MLWYENYIGFLAIMRKELVRLVRIWGQTIFPSIITMSLYFLIFGQLIGSRIGTMEGIAYMDFIVPGLVMMSVITNAYSNVSSTFFGAKFVRSIEELMVSPVSNHTIILGYISGGVVRGLVVGLVVLLVSMFFTKVSFYNWQVALLVAVLASMLFSIIGLINGIFARKFDDVTIIPTFILTPLIYLGGVFYSIELLPALGRSLSAFNPILYVINAFRYGFLGISDINVTASVAAIGIFTGFMYIVAFLLLHYGIGMRR